MTPAMVKIEIHVLVFVILLSLPVFILAMKRYIVDSYHCFLIIPNRGDLGMLNGYVMCSILVTMVIFNIKSIYICTGQK